MTDDDRLTMKVTTHDGDDIEIPARSCEHCDGTGILAQPMSVKRQSLIDESAEPRIIRAKPGDQCPWCLGRGMTGIADGKPREIPPKPSEIN